MMLYLTISLTSSEFLWGVVNEGEARVNCRLIEIESEKSNRFSKKQTCVRYFFKIISKNEE